MSHSRRPGYFVTRLIPALRSSMWLVPGLMIAGGAGLAFGTIAIDRAVGGARGLELGIFYLQDPDGARSVLATIAGSMITVAGVTFSITAAVLALASQQYGPRLVGNFMRDRGNQVVLGAFLAVFVFCLLVMLEIGYSPEPFVPAISTLTGVVLAIVDLGMLVYFIHHVADSIQADSILTRLGHELDRTIRRVMPEKVEQACGPHSLRAGGRPILAEDRGYVQAIDEDELIRIAREIGGTVELRHATGAYVLEDEPIAWVHDATEVEEEAKRSLRGAIYVGDGRTPEQDIRHGIEQIVELAVRSLSTGINDPFTAARCIDRLAAALAVMAGRQFPSPCRHDETGALRLTVPPASSAEMVALSFDRIRHAGSAHPVLVTHLLTTFAHLIERVASAEQATALREQAAAAVAEALPQAGAEIDRTRIGAAHAAVAAAVRSA